MSAKADEIIAAVRANRALLEGCTGHDFSQAIDRITKQPISGRKVFCDWQCTRCKGWVDGIAKLWFERGLKQGEAEEKARVAACMV